MALRLCQERGAELLLVTKVTAPVSVGQAAQFPAVLRFRTRSRQEQGEREAAQHGYGGGRWGC